MDYQIVTFGNGEILKGVFDAIAMCMNSNTGTLYDPLMRISLIFSGFWSAIYSVWGDYLKAWGKAIVPFVLIPPLLFVPTSKVYVHDVVSNYRDKIDNVPYGLACVTHFITQIGYEITKQVDRVFADVEDLKYHKSGFLMASNLIQQARTFRITNEDMAENMRQFVCQCVAYDAMLGRKYTFEDLRHTDDIWTLVSSNASPIRAFVWREPRKPGEPGTIPQIITCREGVKKFNAVWGKELDKTKGILGIRLFGHTNPLTAKAEFLKFLPISYAFLTGISKTADQILKQQMMTYSIIDGIEQKSTALGNSPNFATRRAYLQQRTTYETLGAMASDSLMAMKAVLEALAYAVFIFIVPLSVLPFGWRILLSWVQILLWLQMWGPLYAVLNFIMTKYASAKTIAMLSTSNPDGVTMASSVGLMNLNADIAAIAGFLSLSVPFISVALVKGVGSFVHMASHLGGVGQGAAAQAAGDAVSGNYSFGNISEGNVQMANTNMLAFSRAASYKAGSFHFADGRTEITTMADGSQVANVAVSNVPITLNRTDNDMAQTAEAAGKSYQDGLSFTESSANNFSNAYKTLASLSKSLGNSQSMNDGVSQGVSAEQSKDINETGRLIKQFSDAHKIDVTKGAELFGSITAGGGAFVNVSAGAKGSTSSSDSELLEAAKNFMKETNFQEVARRASQSAKTLSHTLTDEESKKFAREVAGSYEEGMSQRKEASKSFSEAEFYRNEMSHIQANSASINANFTQQFVDWLAKQHKEGTNEVIGMRGALTMMATEPQLVQAYARQFMKEQGLAPKAPMTTNPSKIKAHYDNETRQNINTVNRDPVHKVEEQASSVVNTHMSERREVLRNDVDQNIKQTDQKITQGSSNISQKGSKVQKKVKNQEGGSVVGRAAGKLIEPDKMDAEAYKALRGKPQQK